MISYGGRKRLSSSDSRSALRKSKAEAFKTFVAYAGRYTLNGDKVIHHVEISSIQNWVDTDFDSQYQVLKVTGSYWLRHRHPLTEKSKLSIDLAAFARKLAINALIGQRVLESQVSEQSGRADGTTALLGFACGYKMAQESQEQSWPIKHH